MHIVKKNVSLGAVSAAAALLLAACGGDPTTQLANEPGTDGTSSSSQTEIPMNATQVEFTSTIIDDGNGPELCLGGVLESLPPQCNGTVVDGLVMGDWAQVAQDVSFGERTVVVSWPPSEDNTVTLISDREAEEFTSQFENSFPLPEQCAAFDPATSVDVEDLSNWADANQDIAGIAYFSRFEGDIGDPLTSEELSALDVQAAAETGDPEAAEAQFNQNGIGVLQVKTGNVERATEELTSDGLVPCIQEVDNSMDDLQALRDKIDEDLQRDYYLTGNGIGSTSNDIEVYVAVADGQTIAAIQEKLGTETGVTISGVGKILEGE